MIAWLALGVGATVAAGVYLILSRDLLRCVIGVSVFGVAANLLTFVASRPTSASPPVVPSGQTMLSPASANPLPQALVLTAIVIGFALTCFSLVLVLVLKQQAGVAESDMLRASEPPPGPDRKPPLEGPS